MDRRKANKDGLGGHNGVRGGVTLLALGPDSCGREF
jgi:hypothetical protein